MSTFVIDLLSGKPLLLSKTFGIASGSTIPVWGGIGGNILSQVDLQNQFSTKVNNSFFTGYTASTKTLIDNKLSKSPELSNVDILSYSATTNDYIIGVNATTGNSVNVYLLPISTTGKLTYIIKDQGFKAAINNITIIPSNGNYIENGQTSVKIGINGGSISIYNNGLNNWFIF